MINGQILNIGDCLNESENIRWRWAECEVMVTEMAPGEHVSFK